jgi:malate dehydrogenase (oxaloacetate-decarboxylating)
MKIVMSGAGAAGVAIAKVLLSYGAKNVIAVDRTGAIYTGRPNGMNKSKDILASLTNKEKQEGGLIDIIKGTDIFIGVSGPGVLSKEMVESMNKDPIIFAMANPTPEIMPELALEAGAAVVATGRSDFPNQINNVLAFPGIFKGTLECRAKTISPAMKLAAAKALANMVENPNKDKIIPGPFDADVAKNVAKAVMLAYKEESGA